MFLPSLETCLSKMRELFHPWVLHQAEEEEEVVLQTAGVEEEQEEAGVEEAIGIRHLRSTFKIRY